MEKSEDHDITDINYRRAQALFQKGKIDDPSYLIVFWKAVGVWRSTDTPWVENCHPWIQGLNI